MPSKKYSNTIIYKIQCQKTAIFGHTINLQKLIAKVKNDCMHGNNTKLSRQIMKEGNFDTWEWIILEIFEDCESLLQAKTRVDYYKDQNLLQITPNYSNLLQNRECDENAVVCKKQDENLAAVTSKYECSVCKKEFILGYFS